MLCKKKSKPLLYKLIKTISFSISKYGYYFLSMAAFNIKPCRSTLLLAPETELVAHMLSSNLRKNLLLTLACPVLDLAADLYM